MIECLPPPSYEGLSPAKAGQAAVCKRQARHPAGELTIPRRVRGQAARAGCSFHLHILKKLNN